MLLQGNVPSDWEVVSLVSGPSTTIQFLIAYSKHVIENLPVQTSLGNEAKDTCDQKLDKGEDCPLLPPWWTVPSFPLGGLFPPSPLADCSLVPINASLEQTLPVH